MRLAIAVILVLVAAATAAAQGFTMRFSGDIVVPRGTVQQGAAVTMNGRIIVDGTLQGDALTMNGDVIVSGTVTGSIRTLNGNVQLASSAIVDGDVATTNGRVDQAPGAQVRGRITQGRIFSAPPSTAPQPVPPSTPWQREWRFGWWPGMMRTVASWMMVGFIVLAAAITALVPRQIHHIADALAEAPGEALLAGFILWILLPPLALALVISVVGIPIAAFLPLAVMVLCLVGFAGATTLIGGRIVGAFQGPRSPALDAVVGAAVLGIFIFIPGLGWLAILLALTWGVGGVVMLIVRRIRRSPPAPAPPPAPV